MAFDLNLPIRAVQFVFAVIALGLNGYSMILPFLLIFHFVPSPPLHFALRSWLFRYNEKNIY